ncbi:hypothetical protein [Streptomyces brevispora]|uniref:Uncharacterized protein n=1 Tax=Streptomyces brevispora TaxID=887462 RepID=A0A561TYP0_9ACTN|nr:hypothetical protein [Streptomyces brevispora]TWF92208.1 hypothetical protein FHX80_12528 [Streptomyces brevispora]WSC11497.1 hypothetical protein OIE64_00440 [Streptomyces brevispora]WSC17614.1 hypothetical protein OIE64_35600 [Streptomyces brevispora]
MEDSEHQPQPEPESRDQELTLKHAIEAAYQGTSTPTAQPLATTPQAVADAQDPRIAHGVLLLKARRGGLRGPGRAP